VLAAVLLGACGLAACSSGGGGGGGGTDSAATGSARPAAVIPAAVSPAAARAAVFTFGVAGTQGPVLQTRHEAPAPIAGIGASVTQIATSNSDTYALTSAGAVWAWGVGSYGELGNGTTPLDTLTAVRVDFPPGVTITSLPDPMPFDGGLAIDADGNAWAWGLDATNDLCLPGGTAVLSRPEKIPLSDVTLGTGARTHSLFVSHGTLDACGSGEFGELGNGSTTSSAVPTPVRGLPKGPVRALTSSWGGSGALMADGSYYDWGYNQAGQLGNGTAADSAVPVRVDLPTAVSRVFQGGSGPNNGQTIALLADGSLWTWGNGAYGQLGDGRADSSTAPVRVTLPRGHQPVAVASGGFACYAIDQSGRLWAWGRDDDGQLGTGSSGPDQLRPVSTGLMLTQISSTAQNAAGLAVDAGTRATGG